MKTKGRFFLSALAAIVVGCLAGCQDALEDSDHYRAPDWLKGSAYQTLQQEGGHEMFLRAVDLSPYKNIVEGKSIVTVFAPDDNAFALFLKQKGYGSVDELDAADHDYLSALVGFHLMYYAFDWEKLVNFRPADGDLATDEDKAKEAGCYYKHRTHSQDAMAQERVRLTAGATSDTLLTIYHYERYLPVFSNKLFETKQIDAAYNYNYFYPDTRWCGASGDKGGFNVAGAAVADAGNVITDHGYLYHIDHVLEPLPTIYDELKSRADYSQFLSLYDSYSTYDQADAETNTSLGLTAWVHSHGDLPHIAWEWPVLQWSKMEQLEKEAYNVFAPSNAAMDNFFRTFWTPEGGYRSLEELDPLITQYFIRQSFSEDNNLAFPEEIKAGTVLTPYKSAINIDPDKVSLRRVCSNGLLYGMDTMDAPAIFSAVVGPAFKDTTYQCQLYCYDGSKRILPLASQETEFVTLMPTNKQFLETEPSIRLYTTTSGKELQQWSDDDAAYATLGSGTMTDIVELHTAQNVGSLPQTGVKVIASNKGWNYWYVKDGRITTSALFKEQIEPNYQGVEPTMDGTPYVALHPILNNGGTWSNGSSYSYDYKGVFKPTSGDQLSYKFAVCNDKNYPYYMFAQLLQKAGLIVSNRNAAVANGLSPVVWPEFQKEEDRVRYFVFVPTNEAIIQGLAKIPGCSKLKIQADGTLKGTVSASDKAKLSNYLQLYFVNSQMNVFTAYPYIGSPTTGLYVTPCGKKISLTDTGTTLAIEREGEADAVSVSQKYDCLPFVYTDGCMHFVDSLLGE